MMFVPQQFWSDTEEKLRRPMRLFRRSVNFLSPPPGDLDSWSDRLELASDSRSNEVANPGGRTTSTEAVSVRTRLRADQPWVRRSGHASSARALAAALDPAARHAAIQAYNEAMYAPSSQAPQTALLRAWARFHKAWFGSTTPVYPITVSSLKAIASMFKAGGYGSYKNYLYAAKSYQSQSRLLLGSKAGEVCQGLHKVSAERTRCCH